MRTGQTQAEPSGMTASAGAGDGVYPFFALACAITWALDLPYVLASLRHETPPAWALGLTGLGAFGPMLAAIVIAGRRRELRGVFGRWRTGPVWILVGLALSPCLHLVATSLEVALGGRPAHWFYPPVEPERLAALVVFPIGEEFGWRGFAYPRLADRHGPVRGSLILGAFWTLWHLGMMFGPDKRPDLVTFGSMLALLLAGSVVWAWVFERGSRSMAVAIALHMSAHLDNDQRAPESEVRLRVLRLAVMVIAAVFAARALSKNPGGRTSRAGDSR
ncbi:MAG: type II CAAX endopeptidase family protein [Polyangiaceae bacterium]